MSYFQRLLGLFKAKPRTVKYMFDPITNPLTVEHLARQLNLEARGAELGAQGVPRADSQNLTGPEAEAVAYVDLARTQYLYWGRLRLQTHNEQLNRLDIRQSAKSALSSDERFIDEANLVLTHNRPHLEELRAKAQARQDAFDKFCRTNRLEGQLPHHPEGLWAAAHWMVAFALVAIEAVINAKLFAKGLAGGMLDGFTEAAIAALINVAAALTVGYAISREIHHRRWWRKLIGVAGTILGLLLSIIIALLIAHYREALIEGNDLPGQRARQTIAAQPLDLELTSWMLFAISVAFALVAFVDGRRMSDLYPGFSQCFKRRETAVSDYRAAIAGLNEHMSRLRESYIEELDKAIESCRGSLTMIRNTIDGKKKDGQMLKQTIAMVEVTEAALQLFRTANERARRREEPLPDYFGQYPSPPKPNLPSFDTKNDEVSLAEQSDLYAKLLLDESRIRAKIQTSFAEKFSEIESLSQRFVVHSEEEQKKRMPQTPPPPSAPFSEEP